MRFQSNTTSELPVYYSSCDVAEKNSVIPEISYKRRGNLIRRATTLLVIAAVGVGGALVGKHLAAEASDARIAHLSGELAQAAEGNKKLLSDISVGFGRDALIGALTLDRAEVTVLNGNQLLRRVSEVQDVVLGLAEDTGISPTRVEHLIITPGTNKALAERGFTFNPGQGDCLNAVSEEGPDGQVISANFPLS